MFIRDNIRIIREKISVAAEKAGRDPKEVKLVAVSKRFPVEAIKEAMAADQFIFGENYIQELQSKKELAPTNALFHFIGHLQSNKAKIAAETCHMIETVDSLKLARILNNHLKSLGKTMDVLLQINIGNEPQKAGITADDSERMLSQLHELENLRVCGLMAMPPLATNPEDSRPYFYDLRKLSERLSARQLFPKVTRPELSMGMSEDFQIAIAEGATIVRVGSAIFGKRG
jgi:PLP dependent protein